MIAGLTCTGGEFFAQNGLNHLIIGGSVLKYPEFPLPVLKLTDNSITPRNHRALDEMNISSLHDRRNKWIRCNLANLDHVPDYQPGEKTLAREVVACEERGQCKQEGFLCLTLTQSTGLTSREIETLTYIGLGLLDKEIAFKMGISENTVAVHTKHLREKTGCLRKAELAIKAKELNLV